MTISGSRQGSQWSLAIRDQRDPAFYPKMWVCKSAPFITRVKKLPAADPDQTRGFWVCVSVSYSFCWLTDKELLGLRVCKDQLAQPSF